MVESENIAVVGIPVDENSTFMRGAASAPDHIRKALHCDSSNLCAESGLDLGDDQRWRDVGDLVFDPKQPSFEQVVEGISDLINRNLRILSLGGDHSVTYPIVKAHAKKYPGLTILHLDAHPDLYDDFEGNRFSHASPFARIMEEGLASRLVQVGIRTMNPHQQEQAERFGVEVLSVHDFENIASLKLESPLYLSIDMDVLDPCCAPGVSHHSPGGFMTREVIEIIQSLRCDVIGVDIVEVNPQRDLLGMTAMVAAKLLKETLAKMLEGDASTS